MSPKTTASSYMGLNSTSTSMARTVPRIPTAPSRTPSSEPWVLIFITSMRSTPLAAHHVSRVVRSTSTVRSTWPPSKPGWRSMTSSSVGSREFPDGSLVT